MHTEISLQSRAVAQTRAAEDKRNPVIFTGDAENCCGAEGGDRPVRLPLPTSQKSEVRKHYFSKCLF